MEKATHRKMITTATGPIPDSKLWEYEDYANTFRIVAIDYVFDSDDIQTEVSDLTERQECEIAEQVIAFLFRDNGNGWYQELIGHGLSAEAAGTKYAAIRSGHSGWLLNDKATEEAKSYGDFGIA